MPVEAGLSGEVHHTVGDADTAIALGSGDVAVLATPRLLAWCEEATVRCLDGHLDEATTTVGMRIQLDHIAPTVTGREIVATASLERVEGRRLTFAVTAVEGDDVIAEGRVTRVIVDRERFLTRLR